MLTDQANDPRTTKVDGEEFPISGIGVDRQEAPPSSVRSIPVGVRTHPAVAETRPASRSRDRFDGDRRPADGAPLSGGSGLGRQVAPPSALR